MSKVFNIVVKKGDSKKNINMQLPAAGNWVIIPDSYYNLQYPEGENKNTLSTFSTIDINVEDLGILHFNFLANTVANSVIYHGGFSIDHSTIGTIALFGMLELTDTVINLGFAKLNFSPNA